MIPALLAYLPGLLLTLLLEAVVVAALTRRAERRASLHVCLALNLFTHPCATLLAWRWVADVVALELVVLFCEWLGYLSLLPLRWPRALWLAVAANLASWAAGLGLWLWRMTP